MDSSKTIYQFDLELPNGKVLSLSEYKNNVIMFVNIATRCGFTKQLGEMEKLKQQYDKRPFVLIAIPTNDYGSQTPEENLEVESFCHLKYNTSFIVTSKLLSKGNFSDIHPFFRFLYEVRGKKSIKWNFEKFIFNKNGTFVDYFSSLRSPASSKIIALINSLL